MSHSQVQFHSKLWAVVIATIACAGCTNAGYLLYKTKFSGVQETVAERVLRTGVLRVGTSPDYPPFESLQDTPEGLEIGGYDILLMEKIVENLSQYYGIDIEMRIEAAFFNALMAGLNAKAYDVVIAAFAIREYREREVDFSLPYFISRQCCVVPVSENSITSVEDLEGRKVAVQQGTTGEEISAGMNLVQLPFPTVDMMILNLNSGEAEAAIMDIPVAQHFAKGDDVKIGFNFTEFDSEGFGVAMREGEGPNAFMGVINTTITWMNETGQLETLWNEI